MTSRFHLDTHGLGSVPEGPKYRLLYEKIKLAISLGDYGPGEKLPPLRELAGQSGLHKHTVAAAYELLEAEGLIRQVVGSGSFVAGEAPARLANGVAPEPLNLPGISFATSRPSELLFPMEEFRATCRDVIDSPEAAHILQLGAASGYGPLRRYLLDEARAAGAAGDNDDILIISGCQQGFDLIQRVLASNGETVLIEDPVYPGLRNALARGGARVAGVPLGDRHSGGGDHEAEGNPGLDMEALGRLLEKERPRLLVLTPSFQNPTGLTLPEDTRREVLNRVAQAARKWGTMLIENDLYSTLRYRGPSVPRLKELDTTGRTVLLASFSKIAFPGLRVGWAIGPRELIAQLAEAKETSDLHTDQLSQAVLLRFAQSGRMRAHLEKTIGVYRQRLESCLEACAREFPSGIEFTAPEGGMNIWVTLPSHMDAGVLAAQAVREGVSFMPGKHFAVSRPHAHSLRLSFAGLEPGQIRAGIGVLGRMFRGEMDRDRTRARREPSPVVV